MAVAYDVKLYEISSGDVIGTFLGIVPDEKEAKFRCVRRSTRLTAIEKMALVNKVKYGFESGNVPTQKWAFTVETSNTELP